MFYHYFFFSYPMTRWIIYFSAWSRHRVLWIENKRTRTRSIQFNWMIFFLLCIQNFNSCRVPHSEINSALPLPTYPYTNIFYSRIGFNFIFYFFVHTFSHLISCSHSTIQLFFKFHFNKAIIIGSFFLVFIIFFLIFNLTVEA